MSPTRYTLGAALGTLALASTACVAADENPDIDQAQLAVYRSALPTRAKLEASRTTATTATLLGQPAEYPRSSGPLIVGINGAVGHTVDMLEFVTSLPPTVYNSQTQEFVWGPFAGDDYGYVAAYIKDTGDAGDFRYEYAFLRGASNDLATLTPIIYGGATPNLDNDDYGVGVTVWDMTADHQFAADNDPAFDTNAAHDSGRFAALFAAGPDASEPGNDLAVVVAVFRDFVGKDSEDGLPIDLDYLYGRVSSAEHTIDFVDFQAGFDVSEPSDGVAEDIGVRLAFLDEGTGRAEADAIGGSLLSGQSYSAVECWDTSLNQTFLSANVLESGSITQTQSLGEPADCGLFNATLDEMSVPRLEDVDADLLAALDLAASNGL